VIQLGHFIEELTKDSRCPDAGVVVAGDFNTSLDDPRFQHDDSVRYMMGEGYYWPFAALSPDARKTWQGQGDYPAVQFDHFLTRNVGKPVASVPVTGSASDHRPIVISIDPDDIKAGAASVLTAAPAR
jgi:endonuclease/exonuclease/phosphatase family metal-dependent hydrolase